MFAKIWNKFEKFKLPPSCYLCMCGSASISSESKSGHDKDKPASDNHKTSLSTQMNILHSLQLDLRSIYVFTHSGPLTKHLKLSENIKGS